jgi:hypothetical protein
MNSESSGVRNQALNLERFNAGDEGRMFPRILIPPKKTWHHIPKGHNQNNQRHKKDKYNTLFFTCSRYFA